MPEKSRVVIDRLTHKLRFVESQTRADDHDWYELKLPGCPTIFTRVSHGPHEIDDRLLGLMAKQMRVKPPFFKEVIGCTKSLQDYVDQVVSNPYPPWDVKF